MEDSKLHWRVQNLKSKIKAKIPRESLEKWNFAWEYASMSDIEVISIINNTFDIITGDFPIEKFKVLKSPKLNGCRVG